MDENKINGSENPTEEELKLREEMEELARTFQEELDKAKAEEELLAGERDKEREMLIQELDDDVDTEAELPEEIPEDELCECCGEKRRGTKDNPDSPYCRDCERGLRRYPFEAAKIIFVMLVVALSIFACIKFTDNAELYAISAKADRYERQRKLVSAYSSYQNVLNMLETDSVNAELVYQRAVRNMLEVNMLDDIPQYEEKFRMFEFKLPHLRSAYNTFVTSEGFRITQLDGYQVLYEYMDELDKNGEDYTKLPYSEIIGRLDALLSMTTEESYKYQASLAEGAEDSPDYPVKVNNYNEAIINFVKFYAAALSEQDPEVQIGYLEKIRAAYPELTWLYSAFLGDLYNRTGRDVTELCSQVSGYNEEDDISDVILTSNLRIKGNYTDSIALAQKNIDTQSSYSYEFYRQQAMCYLCTGDYNKAFETASEAYKAYSYSIQVCNTYALSALAAGKADAYDEIAKLYESNNLEMSEEVLAYKNGETDIETILTKGDFDIL